MIKVCEDCGFVAANSDEICSECGYDVLLEFVAADKYNAVLDKVQVYHDDLLAAKDENSRLRGSIEDAVEALEYAHDVFVDEWNHGNKLPQFDRAMKEIQKDLNGARKVLDPKS